MSRTTRQKHQFLCSIALSAIAVTFLVSGVGSALFGYISSVLAAMLFPPAVVHLFSGFAPLICCVILLGYIWYQFVRLLMIAEEILLEKISHPKAKSRQWSSSLSTVPTGDDLMKYLSLQEHSPPSLA